MSRAAPLNHLDPEYKRREELKELQMARQALERQHLVESARRSLMPFIKLTMPDPSDHLNPNKSVYENARHHDAISASIEAFVRGELDCGILILTTPPRHGKSEIVSRRLPAWLMGLHPEQDIVLATYNDDFAGDFGSEVREIMRSPGFREAFPGVHLARGGAAKDRIKTNKGGQGTFVGVGGSLTGRGAHVLLIDDLIKDYEQARSQAFRDRAWEWFTKVAMTRRMGKKLVIITFTRWHSDDIIGRLTDPENEHFNRKLAKGIKVINFPAIAEEDDPLGRKPGEALWPSRYDLDFLEEQRGLDPLGFEALYQQRPSLADGDMFKREDIKYYDPEDIKDLDLRIYCASDHAVATGQRSDSTVLLRVGLDRTGTIYLLDCWWRKAKTDAVVEAMIEMGRKHPQPLTWWAEKGHISKSIGPFLRKRMDETDTFFMISEVTPAGDKAQRAQSISARMAMGHIRFPRGAPWVEKAINELLAFPNGLHDDFVDAFAYIGLGLRGMFPKATPRAPAAQPRSGTLGWIKAEQKRVENAAKMRVGLSGGL